MSAAKKAKAPVTLPPVGPTFSEKATGLAPLADIVKTVMPAVVHIEALHEDIENSGAGSGFVIDGKNGYIITNHHVIADAKRILVTFPDEDSYTATLVGAEPLTDVAVLKLKKQKQDVPQATMGNSDLMDMGSSVIAIGNPFGLKYSVSTGIISGLHRSLGHSLFDDYIQTDAAINPGNSGGPLFNRGGQVIGMNTSIYSGGTGASAGVGFAIPANQVRWTAQKLIQNGEVRRAMLGIGIIPVTTTLAEKFGLAARQGVFIDNIGRNTPAWKGGLRTNDIILSMDGRTVNSMSALREVISECEPQQTISIGYWRKGDKHETNVQLGEAVWQPPEEELEIEVSPEEAIAEIFDRVRDELKEELYSEIMQDVARMIGPRKRMPIKKDAPLKRKPAFPHYRPGLRR